MWGSSTRPPRREQRLPWGTDPAALGFLGPRARLSNRWAPASHLPLEKRSVLGTQFSASRGPASPEGSMPRSRSEARRFGEGCGDWEPSAHTAVARGVSRHSCGLPVGCVYDQNSFHCYLILQGAPGINSERVVFLETRVLPQGFSHGTVSVRPSCPSYWARPASPPPRTLTPHLLRLMLTPCDQTRGCPGGRGSHALWVCTAEPWAVPAHERGTLSRCGFQVPSLAQAPAGRRLHVPTPRWKHDDGQAFPPRLLRPTGKDCAFTSSPAACL